MSVIEDLHCPSKELDVQTIGAGNLSLEVVRDRNSAIMTSVLLHRREREVDAERVPDILAEAALYIREDADCIERKQPLSRGFQVFFVQVIRRSSANHVLLLVEGVPTRILPGEPPDYVVHVLKIQVAALAKTVPEGIFRDVVLGELPPVAAVEVKGRHDPRHGFPQHGDLGTRRSVGDLLEAGREVSLVDDTPPKGQEPGQVGIGTGHRPRKRVPFVQGPPQRIRQHFEVHFHGSPPGLRRVVDDHARRRRRSPLGDTPARGGVDIIVYVRARWLLCSRRARPCGDHVGEGIHNGIQ